jgi:hypothetical protein
MSPDSGTPGGQEPGALLRSVEERLIARGLQVRRMPDPRSRLVKASPVSVTNPTANPASEVVVEDDGYIEVRYWPPADQPADLQKVADLVADILFRNLSSPPKGRS